MKRQALAMVPVLGLLLTVGCAPRVESPGLRPGSVADEAIRRYDKNGDGKLSVEEQDPALKAIAKIADKDKDGALTSAEIAERVKFHVDSQVGLVDVEAVVLLDGQPVEGATVRLIPDPVLEGVVKPATGKTEATGAAPLRTEGTVLPGAQPGFYRVEVSRKDATGLETIPLRYNVETELGADIGLDSGRGSLRLELKSR